MRFSTSLHTIHTVADSLTPNAALTIEHVEPAKLRPAPYNPRKMDVAERKRLERGIQEFGLVDPIVARRSDRMVIGGHQRLASAKALGLETVPVVYLDDISDDRAAALNILLNNPAAQGEWDLPKLTDILSELDAHGFDATLTGFDDDELRKMLAPSGDLLTDPDEVPPLPVEPITKLGDLITLGQHRLLCGDATKAEDVARLMGGDKVQMVYTDPPYGVTIVDKRGMVFDDSSMKAKQIMPHVVGAYKPIVGDDSTDTAIAAYRVCAALKIPTLIFWGGNLYAEALPPSSCWIVWDKDNGESFFGDAELAWTNQKTAIRICKHMWNGLIKASERGEKRVHPTQKPVALAEWCFDKYGATGDAVLDLFGGSGSTLIAAEKSGRRAFVAELAPDYCDVIVTRWQNATGQTAVRP